MAMTAEIAAYGPISSRVQGKAAAIIVCLRQLEWKWPELSGAHGPVTKTGRNFVRALVEPLPRTLKRFARRPRNEPAIRVALGVVQAGWWAQGIAHEAGLAKHGKESWQTRSAKKRTSCGKWSCGGSHARENDSTVGHALNSTKRE